ncbi:hypothetical protein [Bacillus alveayuensis]|jgi:hypothetical protein|nr:hypothetical protein [Bacillus alveayuensis]
MMINETKWRMKAYDQLNREETGIKEENNALFNYGIVVISIIWLLIQSL